MADLGLVRLDLLHQPECFEVLDDLLPRDIPVEPGVVVTERGMAAFSFAALGGIVWLGEFTELGSVA